jgi:hypothetical protein
VLIRHIFGIILLPLQDDKRVVWEGIDNFKEIFEFYGKEGGKNVIESAYIKENNQVLIHPYGKKIEFILSRKPFFRRLPAPTLSALLPKV